MKRAVLALLSTIAGLVAVLGYRVPSTATHLDGSADLGSLAADAASDGAGVTTTTGAPSRSATMRTTTTARAGASVPASTTSSTSPRATSSTAATSKAGAGTAATSSSTSVPKATTTTTAPKRTVVGSVVSTKYGPVQVAAVVQGTQLVDVKFLQYPTGSSTSTQINEQALPKLRSEALAAQAASVATVSGATYTSQGFRSSLQSALRAAWG